MQLTKDEIDALLPEPAATNQPCIHTTTDRWAMQLVAHANWPVGTTFFTRDQLTAFAAAVIAAHTAKVLGDVEPVAWQKADRQATEDGFAIIGWLPCTKHEYNALLIPKRALYPAHTVAALAARVAELEQQAETVAATERERICAAIKAEDDHCITGGDYMLDSDDCIKVARGQWVRPVWDAAPDPTQWMPLPAAQPGAQESAK